MLNTPERIQHFFSLFYSFRNYTCYSCVYQILRWVLDSHAPTHTLNTSVLFQFPHLEGSNSLKIWWEKRLLDAVEAELPKRIGFIWRNAGRRWQRLLEREAGAGIWGDGSPMNPLQGRSELPSQDGCLVQWLQAKRCRNYLLNSGGIMCWHRNDINLINISDKHRYTKNKQHLKQTQE